jgi:hypothetical protein
MTVKCWNLYSNDTLIGLSIGNTEEEALKYAKCFLPNLYKRHETLRVKPYGHHEEKDDI